MYQAKVAIFPFRILSQAKNRYTRWSPGGNSLPGLTGWPFPSLSSARAIRVMCASSSAGTAEGRGLSAGSGNGTDEVGVGIAGGVAVGRRVGVAVGTRVGSGVGTSVGALVGGMVRVGVGAEAAGANRGATVVNKTMAAANTTNASPTQRVARLRAFRR